MQIDELIKIANAATPGPWENMRGIYIYSKHFPVADVMERDGALGTVRGWGHLSTTLGYEEAEKIQNANAEHIATFDPQTVIALLEGLKAFRSAASLGKQKIVTITL